MTVPVTAIPMTAILAMAASLMAAVLVTVAGPVVAGPVVAGPVVAGGVPRPAPAGTGPSLGALVNITVPWTLWQGDIGPPGEVAGFGILDHDDTRDAVAAATRNPDSRWCVTLLNPDGTAAAHGCARRPHQWPHGPPEPLTSHDPLATLKIRNVDVVIRGPCDHSQAEDRYRPSRRLQHLTKARNATCTAPGCGSPAARCDLDHTDPHHRAGRPAPATWPRCAVITIGASRPTAGDWNSPNPAC